MTDSIKALQQERDITRIFSITNILKLYWGRHPNWTLSDTLNMLHMQSRYAHTPFHELTDTQWLEVMAAAVLDEIVAQKNE